MYRFKRICFAPDPAGGGGAGDQPGSWGALDAAGQKVVTDNGWKSPADAVTNYSKMTQRIGSMVAIPGADATPDQIGAFHAKLGVPADGKYDLADFKRPDGLVWDDAAQAAILADMHKTGATPATVKAALNGYTKFAAGAQKLRDDHATAVHAKTEPVLRQKWGDKYDQHFEAANKAVATIFGTKVEEATKLRLEDGSYLLDHPTLAEAFAKVGLGMSEDGELGGRNDSPGGGGASDVAKMTPEQAKAEIAKIRSAAVADAKHPYNDRANPEYKKAQVRMNELYARANAGRAVVD